tara:strand:- start:712 stop:1593 length:882 start_codon:yes stop_codon:yes gene_type:complete
MNIKHSKYKNTGILFELLTKQIASDVLSGIGIKNSKSIYIVEKYFNKKMELGKELVLYRSFFSGKKLTETKSLDYINVITEQRKKLNTKKLKEEKYDLIKEIKENYDLGKFLSNRVPSYKIYASVYKIFESSQQGYTFENVQELSEAKYTLVEYLCGEVQNKNIVIESEVINTLKEQEEDLRLLTYKIILEKFNKKYKNLNDNQINLLKEFLNKGSDRHHLLTWTKEQSKNLVHSLERKVKAVKNEVHVIKITEVINQLKNFETLTNVKNNYLTALMIGYELDSQLNNFQQND